MLDAIQNLRSVRTRVELNFALSASFRRLAAGTSNNERAAALVIGQEALPVYHPLHAGEGPQALQPALFGDRDLRYRRPVCLSRG